MPYTKLRFHFVFSTKKRRPLITSLIEAELYAAIWEAVYRCGGIPIALNGDPSHVHLLCAVKPSIALSDFIGRVKCNSSRIINEKFPGLKFKWQKGFGAFTVCPYDHDELVDYIRNQKKHHANGTTIDELEKDGPDDE